MRAGAHRRQYQSLSRLQSLEFKEQRGKALGSNKRRIGSTYDYNLPFGQETSFRRLRYLHDEPGVRDLCGWNMRVLVQ